MEFREEFPHRHISITLAGHTIVTTEKQKTSFCKKTSFCTTCDIERSDGYEQL